MSIDTETSQFDAIIVGGSYSGISAGMQLARARKKILIIDAGVRRNRFAVASHGFIGRDGRSPGEIAEEGRKQLEAYSTVSWVEGLAVSASKMGEGFSIELGDGRVFLGRRIVLATGVEDVLPDIEGMAERWGRSVFHCPYCHGYELNQGKIGVIASVPMSQHQAMILPEWGHTTFFTNGVISLDENQLAALVSRGVMVEKERVARITDRATVELVDGRRFEMDGIFTASKVRMTSPLAEQLGCELEEGPLGFFIRTDVMTKETSVPGVFACGDAARMAGNIAIAVGDGAQAGAGTHQSLIFR